MSELKEKTLKKCSLLDCYCRNAEIDIDFPTQENVINWHDCVLCILGEILTKIKEKKVKRKNELR